VLCTEVIEHLAEPEKVIREFARLLRPGGRLMLTAPLGSGIHQEPHHYFGGFTPWWHRRVLDAAGFDAIQVEANAGSFRFFSQESLRFLSGTMPFRGLPLLPQPAVAAVLAAAAAGAGRPDSGGGSAAGPLRPRAALHHRLSRDGASPRCARSGPGDALRHEHPVCVRPPQLRRPVARRGLRVQQLPAPRCVRSGHDVHHFESWDRAAQVDFAALNTVLLDRIDVLRPDLVFCVLMGYEIWSETLQTLRDAGPAGAELGHRRLMEVQPVFALCRARSQPVGDHLA
jgi:hypothetical protein